MLVSEFKANKLDILPTALYTSLPADCESCGYPMEMLETLTELRCSNPKCPDKLKMRLLSLGEYLCIEELDIDFVTKLVDYMRARSIENILFLYKCKEVPELNNDICARICAQLDACKDFDVIEYVKLHQLPFIGVQNIERIFAGYTDLFTFYKDLEATGLEFIMEKLGKEQGNISVRALKILEVLSIFKEDLLTGLDYLG